VAVHWQYWCESIYSQNWVRNSWDYSHFWKITDITESCEADTLILLRLLTLLTWPTLLTLLSFRSTAAADTVLVYFATGCTATRCNRTCNTWQHTATRCNRTCNTWQHTATHCNTRQHMAAHCNTLQHMMYSCYRVAKILTLLILLQNTNITDFTWVVDLIDMTESFWLTVSWWQFVWLCCSVLQCAAMCCSVLQCVAVCCSVHLTNITRDDNSWPSLYLWGARVWVINIFVYICILIYDIYLYLMCTYTFIVHILPWMCTYIFAYLRVWVMKIYQYSFTYVCESVWVMKIYQYSFTYVCERWMYKYILSVSMQI